MNMTCKLPQLACRYPYLFLLGVKDGTTIRPIAFLWGGRELRLRRGRRVRSCLPLSNIRPLGSRHQAVHLEMRWLLVDVSGQ